MTKPRMLRRLRDAMGSGGHHQFGRHPGDQRGSRRLLRAERQVRSNRKPKWKA